MTREKGSNEARMPQARNGPAPEQGGGRLKSPPKGRYVQQRFRVSHAGLAHGGGTRPNHEAAHRGAACRGADAAAGVWDLRRHRPGVARSCGDDRRGGMVATPALKRAAWVGAAGLAAGLIIILAWHGRRPDPGLVRFEPGGVMVHLRLEDVVEVQVRAGNHHQSFARSPTGTWSMARTPVPVETVQRLESGLRFLHVSAP